MNNNQRALAAGLISSSLLFAAGGVQAGAIIGNGTIQLGVNDHGHLNAPYAGDPLGIGAMGLRFVPTGAASTEPGCLCEGWGAAILSSGVKGGANESVGGVAPSLSLVSFSSGASTATSVVNINNVAGGAPVLQVTHDYRPLASTPYLYEVAVTIKNLSGDDIAAGDLVYRRVMDWDIYPTPFSEYVTIQGVPALLGIANGSNVLQTDNNGFNSWDPTSFSSYGQHNVNFTDNGPRDHGALFDFNFAALGAGNSFTFYTYYGAAPDEATADLARRMVDGDASDVDIGLYSYGQSSQDGGDHGTPNTFIFGFGVSGGVFVDPDRPVPEPATLALMGLGLAGLSVMRKRKVSK